ncbi:MAG: cupredoxin domain-containing protein [Dehalococcoidia bacterium]
MRKNRLLGLLGTVIAVTALGAVVAACDDDEGGGDATATAPVATEPDATSSQAPDETATTEATASGSTELEIEAEDTAFSTDTLEAPAGEAFSVAFTNSDDGIGHTFSLYASQAAVDANEDPIASSELLQGPAERSVDVPALDAGEYYFQCDIHTSMNGTLTAQ